MVFYCDAVKKMMMMMEADENDNGTVRKTKMEEMKVEDGDTCEEMEVSGTIGGHSTFEIRLLRRLGR